MTEPHTHTIPLAHVVRACSVDEAGQYLTAYKQSECRPPTLIHERVYISPGVLLRTALTSIPRVNKTDVEILTRVIWSRLPSSRPKMVARLKDTFELPFRTSTVGDTFLAPDDAPTVSASASTSATTATSACVPPSGSRGDGSAQTGKDTTWDIELDLNSPAPAKVRKERESPLWDIELDEGAPFPTGDEIESSSDDTDTDIALALRAKRQCA
ncbi:hypothetical protein BJY52DRAFT_1212659 [Lactarius psammicola]|nr:hypothetical protein BJY52DRAFT_1212611 [Lactarius psammicola]KAI9457259.1 hypothetical protein BJY52DRAFT_1212659 [Lactarius psammicola]